MCKVEFFLSLLPCFSSQEIIPTQTPRQAQTLRLTLDVSPPSISHTQSPSLPDFRTSQVAWVVNNPPANAGDLSLADFTASVFHPSFSSLCLVKMEWPFRCKIMSLLLFSLLFYSPPFCFIPSHPTLLYSILSHPIPVRSVWGILTQSLSPRATPCALRWSLIAAHPLPQYAVLASVRVSSWHLFCSTPFVWVLGSQVPASIASILVLVLSSHLLMWATPQVPH